MPPIQNRIEFLSPYEVYITSPDEIQPSLNFGTTSGSNFFQVNLEDILYPQTFRDWSILQEKGGCKLSEDVFELRDKKEEETRKDWEQMILNGIHN